MRLHVRLDLIRIRIRNELAEMLVKEAGNNRKERKTDIKPTGPPSHASPYSFDVIVKEILH